MQHCKKQMAFFLAKCNGKKAPKKWISGFKAEGGQRLTKEESESGIGAAPSLGRNPKPKEL
jgi:hypothetical protein